MYTTEQIARICHEANRSLQMIQRDPGVPVAAPWDVFPANQQAGVISGVEKAIAGASPEELHQSWIDFKLADGWKYGPVKSDAEKLHPCLVPYNQLPASQRDKDHLFQKIVEALSPARTDRPASRELIQDDSVWRHRKEHYLVSIEQSGPKYTLFRRRVSVLAGGQRPIRRKLTQQFLKKFELYGPVPS